VAERGPGTPLPAGDADQAASVVDMTAAAITGRLRTMSRLLAERGLVVKGVDMSSEAVTARLRVMSSLADMCLRLAAVGHRLRRS
jgi:hypothetical protein